MTSSSPHVVSFAVTRVTWIFPTRPHRNIKTICHMSTVWPHHTNVIHHACSSRPITYYHMYSRRREKWSLVLQWFPLYLPCSATSALFKEFQLLRSYKISISKVSKWPTFWNSGSNMSLVLSRPISTLDIPNRLWNPSFWKIAFEFLALPSINVGCHWCQYGASRDGKYCWDPWFQMMMS